MRFEIDPTTVRVLSTQTFFLNVRGTGVGFIRCGRARRWVWGAFDETFVVSVPKQGELQEIAVEGMGVGGRQRETVALDLKGRLAVPHVAPRVPRTYTVGLPKLRLPRLELRTANVAQRLQAFRRDSKAP